MYNVLEKLRALEAASTGARGPERSADWQSAVSPTGSRPGATMVAARNDDEGASGDRTAGGLPTRDTADYQSALRTGVAGVRSVTGESASPDVNRHQLTPKEKEIHELGLVSVLKQIHDDLDVAVFAAYGWPTSLTDEEILERLVALNHERAAEEKRGHIR
jgi:hypothetical protein